MLFSRKLILWTRAEVKYLLRATFNAADVGFANGQVLDTSDEMGANFTGQLTVVEVDGTLAIVSNKCAFTTQATPVWGDLGFYSQAITRALGRGLLGTVNLAATNRSGPILVWSDNASATPTLYTGFNFANTAQIHIATEIFTFPAVSFSASTDYQLAVVLGGYDAANGVPWWSGQVPTSYLFGAAFFVKGGAFANWTLLWRTGHSNTATLYAMFSALNPTGTIDDFRVPTADLSAVLQPINLSTFTAANGTSLNAITPEVGGAWTEQSGDFDIQTNRASISVASGGRDVSTVAAGAADVWTHVTIRKTDAVDTGEMGLCLRYTDGNNFWMVHGDLAGNIVEIVERNGGAETQRASAAIALTFGTNYAVQTIAYGQTIDAFLNSANKCTYALAALNQNVTVHGIVGNGTSQTFDNFAVFNRTSSIYDAVLGGV